jgi:hypothetical protein
MSKFKKLVRSVSESAGVSHAGAVNLLRRGARPALALGPLDPVLIRDGARPLAGEHTHAAGLVSAVLPDGTVCVTPAWPRMTAGGLSFYRHEKVARYAEADVRPYRLKRGERFARFVETVFNTVPFDPSAAYSMAETPWIFPRPEGVPAFILGEEGESLVMVSRGPISFPPDASLLKTVVVPMCRPEVDLVMDGAVVGQDAVKLARFLRDRMVALMDTASYDHDLGLPSGVPGSIPDGCEWVIDDIDDTMSRDLGLVLDPLAASKKVSSRGRRFACGSGRVGRHVVGPGTHGLLLLRGEVEVVRLGGTL